MPDTRAELPRTETHSVGPQTIGGNLDSPDWGKVDSMLNELPSGILILPSRDAQNFAKYRYKPSLYPKDEAWKICTNATEKYDGEICKAYRDELDALLVFAGLFSAVVTGFTVESFQWLQDDTGDAMIILLAQIAQSLGRNETAALTSSSSGIAPTVAARINAYWFISLTLSLSSALVSILAKQWVREFERRASDMTPQEILGVRQLKFEGLKHWRVEDIISVLPMLLQISLALFSTGVLELLWQLHTAVAVAVCVPTMAALLFYSATTILPALQYSQQFRYALPLCAYKSPQSLLAVRLYQLVSGARTFSVEYFQSLFQPEPEESQLMTRGGSQSYIEAMAQEFGLTRSWNVWDRGFYVSDRHSTSALTGCSHFRGLHWLLKTMYARSTKEAVWTCLWKEAHSPDAHITDRRLSQYPERREAWLRRGLLHPNLHAPGTLSHAPLWQCAMLYLPRTNMAREFVSEMLIHCLPSMDASTAEQMFGSFASQFSDDPEIATSLVRAVVSYGRRHIYDDMSRIISHTSNIAASCSDYGTRSELQWAVVTLAMQWLSLRPGTMLQKPMANALDMLAGSPDDYIRYPQRLHHLPHIAALAGLLKAAYEAGGWRRLTWPMRGGFCEADLLRFTRDHDSVAHKERLPMVLELFRISVCGVDCASDDPPTATAASDDAPLARCAAPSGTTGTDTAITSRPDSDDLPSPASTPRSGSGIAVHQWQIDAIPSPAEIKDHRSSSAAKDVLPSAEDRAADEPRGDDADVMTAQRALDWPGVRTELLGISTSRALEESTRYDSATEGDLHTCSMAAPWDISCSGSGDNTPLGTIRISEGAARMRPGPPLGAEDREIADCPGASGAGEEEAADPLAVALPYGDTGGAHARETALADGSGGQHQPQAEQHDATRDVPTAVRPRRLPAKTILARDTSAWPPSVILDDADAADALANGAVTGAREEDSMRTADDREESFARHVRTGHPQLSLPLESRDDSHGSMTEDTRAPKEPSTEESRTRTGSSRALGAPATVRLTQTSDQTARIRKLYERTLEAGAILEPNLDASIAADPEGSRTDDQSGTE